jgi:ABC-type phosphate/phosphonate transport system permease subunit
MKKVRTLSEQEERRKAKFEMLAECMTEEGYDSEELTVGILMANVLAVLVMLPWAALEAAVYLGLRGVSLEFFDSARWLLEWLGLLVGMFAAIFAHEGIHGLVWGLCTHFWDIEFGFIREALTPYCTCTQPMARWQYVLGALMPTLVLGVLPGILAVILGSMPLFFFSEVMLFGGGADVLICLKLLRYHSPGQETLYYDHPYKCGLVVFWR